MGLHTTYVGYVEITPALSEQETAYLTAFNASRRVERPGGPFAVPANPWAEEPPVAARDRPPAGQPGLWCPWQPCEEGHCLRWDGQEKPSGGQEWLSYLIDAFLRPGAKARRDRTGRFDGFTFDHTCQGVLVGEGEESREVFALEVRPTACAAASCSPGCR